MARFGSDGVRDLFNGIGSKAARRVVPQKVAARARRQLQSAVAATRLEDLRFPQANRLEKHTEGGRFRGYHSIRINDEYRILFRWEEGAAVEIVIEDYHNK